MIALAVVLITTAVWAALALVAGVGLGRVMARADTERAHTDALSLARG